MIVESDSLFYRHLLLIVVVFVLGVVGHDDLVLLANLLLGVAHFVVDTALRLSVAVVVHWLILLLLALRHGDSLLNWQIIRRLLVSAHL